MNNGNLCHTHHQGCKNKSQSSNCGMVFGLALVVGGTLWLLEHMGLLGGYSVVQFWPALLVLMGLGKFIRPSCVGSFFWGAALVGGGALGLLHTLHIVAVPWNLIWPSALVLLGIYIFISVSARKQRKPDVSTRRESAIENGNIKSKVVMGSQADVYDGDDFNGGQIEVAMGAYELDLRKAQIIESPAKLHVNVVMGEVKLKIPNHWRVVVDGTPVMGNIENKTAQYSQLDDTAPTIAVYGQVVLGALEISH